MARTLFDRDTAPGAEPEDLLRLDIPALVVPGHDAAHATSAARYLEECLPRSDYWDVPVGGADRGDRAGAGAGVSRPGHEIVAVADRYGFGTPIAANAACATITSCSILAPPAATAPTTSPLTVIGKPPGTLVKSPMRTAMLSAFSSDA